MRAEEGCPATVRSIARRCRDVADRLVLLCPYLCKIDREQKEQRHRRSPRNVTFDLVVLYVKRQVTCYPLSVILLGALASESRRIHKGVMTPLDLS